MVSGIVTGALIVLFIAGWVWAWSPRRKADFEDAARMPLGEEGENNPCAQAGSDSSSRWSY